MNVTALNNFGELHVSVKLLLTLISISAPDGAINTSKSDLARYLKTSRQTVGAHIADFAKSGILKYKYSGMARLNPDFYYNGEASERARALEEYKHFKSDV